MEDVAKGASIYKLCLIEKRPVGNETKHNGENSD